MDRVKKLKVKKSDGSFTDYIPIGADAEYIDLENGSNVEKTLKKKPYYFNNVEEMKNCEDLVVGDMAITLGYYEANDGGGAEYQIVNKSSDITIALQNNLYANLIIDGVVNIRQLGAKGNGKDDDIIYIQLAIKSFPTRTIYFPKGHYKISSSIDIPQGNTEYVNIKMDSSTILSATQQINAGIIYGASQLTEKYSRTDKNPVGYIEGGIIDCNLMTNGIQLNSNRQLTQIKYTTFRNISNIGLNLVKGSNYGSGDFKIHFCNFFRKDSYDGTAIHSNCDDNEFQHIRVDGCKIGFNLVGSSNFLHDIHCTALYTTIDDKLNKMNETEAFRSCSGGDKYSQCYADTYATGWRFPAGTGTFKLSECTNYYYDAFLDGATTQAIKIEGSLKIHVDISNCTFNSCRKGDHCFIRMDTSPYKEALYDHQLKLRNNTYIDNYNTTSSLDLGYCLPLNNENYLAPFYMNKTLQADVYYILGEYIVADSIPLELTFKYKDIVNARIIMSNKKIQLEDSSYNTSTRQWKFSICKGNKITIGDRDYQGYYLVFSINSNITSSSEILMSNISPSLFFGKKLYNLLELKDPEIISSIELNQKV